MPDDVVPAAAVSATQKNESEELCFYCYFLRLLLFFR